MKLPAPSDCGVIITRHGDPVAERKPSLSESYRIRKATKEQAARRIVASYRRVELDGNPLGAPEGSETYLHLQANGRLSLSNFDVVLGKTQKLDVSAEQADRVAAKYGFTRVG